MKNIQNPTGERGTISVDLQHSSAYHEAGHTLMHWLAGYIAPEVSIISRGDSAGKMRKAEASMTRQSATRANLLQDVRTALGGRVAEMLIMGKGDGLTTGASRDLEEATEILYRLICCYGMDDEIGEMVISPESPLCAHNMKDKIVQQTQNYIKIVMLFREAR